MRYSLFLRLFLDKSQILCIIQSCSYKYYKIITFINLCNISTVFFNILLLHPAAAQDILIFLMNPASQDGFMKQAVLLRRHPFPSA